MKKRGIQILAAALSALLVVQSPAVSGLFNEYPAVAYANVNRPATVSATTLNVRSGAGTSKSIVSKLSHGAAVTVVGETRDSSGTVWYKIRYTSGTTTKEGYASSQYIKFPVSYTQDTNFETYLNQQGFPESYKDSLRTLHAEHPTWVFQAQKTNLDWNHVIDNESAVGANLVGSSSLSSWKSTDYGAYDWNTGKWTGFDGATWVAASKEIVSYYMDPRNFLNDTYVFQFLNHTYDSAFQTKDGLQSMVKDTFLDAEAVNSSTTANGPGSSNGPGGTLGPGSTTSNPNAPTGPGSSRPTQQPNGPGGMIGTGSSDVEQKGPGTTGGPGSGASTQQSQTSGPAGTSTSSVQQVETVGPAGTSQQIQTVNPGGQNNVSLEGPAASIGASVRERALNILSVPTVEYGPGMDASSITGDNTGASTTAPVPEGQTYVDIIMKAAAQSGVNPYVICAMILQEQGKGTSGSISGKTSGYEGCYNFFNIGAYQAGSMSAVTRGLWYASQKGNYGRPWNTIEKSIVGGSQYYGETYVSQGQDTFYLKKFNVQGSNLYKHQYMTNVEGAAGEGAKLARAYTDDMKNQTLVFKIPVYNNMPETACAKPNGTGSPNNKLSSLTVTGYALTPTFSMNTESYDIIVNPSVDRIVVNASVIDSKAAVTGVGTISLQSGNNTINIEVTAENGTVRTYRLNVVRQSSAPAINVPSGPASGPGSSGTTTVGPGGAGGPGSMNGPGGTGGSASTIVPGGSVSAGPGVPAETTPAVSPTLGGNQNVQAGAGPGAQANTGTPATSEQAGPGGQATTVPPAAETQPTVPETQAPAETAAPETQAPPDTSPQQSASLAKGDCNGDGKVTILDKMLINKHVLGQTVLSGAAFTAADMNGDGSVTSADASALQKMIFGQ